LRCKIITLYIRDYHAHLLVQANSELSPNTIIGRVERYILRVLKRGFSGLRGRPAILWTRSYFVSAHGHVSDETIRK